MHLDNLPATIRVFQIKHSESNATIRSGGNRGTLVSYTDLRFLAIAHTIYVNCLDVAHAVLAAPDRLVVEESDDQIPFNLQSASGAALVTAGAGGSAWTLRTCGTESTGGTPMAGWSSKATTSNTGFTACLALHAHLVPHVRPSCREGLGPLGYPGHP